MSYARLAPSATAVAVLALAACSSGRDTPAQSYAFDFVQGPQQWTAGFADYPAGEEAFYELDAGYRELPESVDPQRRSALYIAGNNHSDDLFMFYKRRVDGLQPNRTYAVRFEVEIATEAQSGCAGIGGAPGESVYLKAGVAAIEPQPVLDGGDYRMNIDKGNQSSGGANALVLGDIANGDPCGAPQRFVRKTLSSGSEQLLVTSDGSGAAWLLVGTDSGFEGSTRLYYTRFAAAFSE